MSEVSSLLPDPLRYSLVSVGEANKRTLSVESKLVVQGPATVSHWLVESPHEDDLVGSLITP